MTAGVQIFKSTDAGAPVLSGTAGALIALLDAVLINGYNSVSVTSITRSGSTATLTSAAHGLATGDAILVAGANESQYNGTFRCTVTSSTTLTYTVTGTPATPATGTITVKRAPAGMGSPWAKAFSGTNLAAYRPPVGGNRLYLRIDDTDTSNARGVGYESMSDVNTGTGDFPTAAQFSGGLYWPKSSTADSTARPWIIAATDRLLIMHVSSSSASNATNASVCVFGDIKSYKPGDAYGTIHIAGTGVTTTSSNNLHKLDVISSPTSGHYIARSHSQLGTAIQLGKHTDSAKCNSTAVGGGALIYPNTPDGGLYLAPLWLHDTSVAPQSVRGTLPGLWAPLHDKPLQHLDTFSGTGTLAGRTFLALKMYNSGEVFLETSDTWDI